MRVVAPYCTVQGVCKEILNRFFVVVTFPALSIIISSQEGRIDCHAFNSYSTDRIGLDSILLYCGELYAIALYCSAFYLASLHPLQSSFLSFNINFIQSHSLSFPFLSFLLLFFVLYTATSIVKLRGNRSQLDRAGVYLKRGVGSFKEREKEERVVTEVRPERKKRSSNKDRDSDNENDFEIRKYKNEYEKSDRKVEVRDREVVLDGGPWKSLDRDREEKDKKDKDKEEFVSVAVTVPCPASRAGCLIGSKGSQSLHHITLDYAALHYTTPYYTTLLNTDTRNS